MCPCGTSYNDNTVNDRQNACCGSCCPTQRHLPKEDEAKLSAKKEEETKVSMKTCRNGTTNLPCYNPQSGSCSEYVWESNVCACGTEYNDNSVETDGTVDQG